jgi:protein-disulfide isomerase
MRSTSRILDVVLVVCAVVMTGLAAARFVSPLVRPSDGARRFPGWREDIAFSRRIGRTDAPYTVVVWTDYQCPACRQFESIIQQARSQLGDSLAVVYRYNPLKLHPLAFPAAVAAECARTQGRFAEMHTTLFATSLIGDSLPVRTLMRSSQLSDTAAFKQCLDDPASAERAAVQTDLSRIPTLRIRGTPGVQIGDRITTGGIPLEELLARLRANHA